MKSISKIISIYLLVLVGLHVWAAIDPSHKNWGFHLFSFYQASVGLTAIGIIFILLIPKFQKPVIAAAEKAVHILANLPVIVNFIAAAGILFMLVYLYPAKLHLLGDGAILLRSVPQGMGGDEITLSFRNQPLMFWIYKWAMNLHPFESAPNAYTVYLSIDVIAAVIFLVLVFWTMRKIQMALFEKIMLAGLIILSAGSQFFFGYVENYILQYISTIGYLVTGWYAIEKRISIIVPITFFVLMILFHLGGLVFLPSLLLLLLLKWKKDRLKAILFIGGVGIAGMTVLYFVGFNIIDMTRHLKSGSVDFLQLFKGGYGNFPYPMFSFAHLLDWFNAHMLLAPLGLFLTIALIFFLPKERRWKNPILQFLLVAAACGMFFTWVINSALGMARDWDLFSSFFLPLVITPVYLLSQIPSFEKRRQILFMISIILLLRTVAWIGINSSEERHMARMRTLNSPELLSKAAQMAYDESLANLFFDTQKYADARIYYEHFMTIDSMNPRIIGNIADVYRRIGERDKYFYQLKRAVRFNTPDPGVYSNLGVEYASRGDTASAILYNEKALEKNPLMQKANANLGILYASRRDFQKADKYFTAAIELGMKEPVLFRYAAEVCTFLRDFERAIRYYDVYLQTNQSDNNARELRNRIFQALQALKNRQKANK